MSARSSDTSSILSGYTLNTSLPGGSYRIMAFMHDALTGTFNLAQQANVTVLQGAPLMALDRPLSGLVNIGAVISGWAVDTGAASGVGVDVVHVWAWPVAGGSPIFVGATPVGNPRPDVAAALGSGRFTNSGFSLTLQALQGGGFVPGQQYDLAVYAHSTVTGTFNQWRVVRVTVN